MKLYFGNKNYSSWSLRPWLLLNHYGISFEEVMVGVSGKSAHDGHRAYAANGLVPCLHLDHGFQIWDTLAISEYLAETYPEHTMYPKDPLARARARSISAEMHSGFSYLRSAMGMNIKMQLKGVAGGIAPSEDVARDIARITEIWTQTRTQWGELTDQPYLFGAFSIADAMFAPVIWRFYSYNVPLTGAALAYHQTMLAHPHMQAWQQAALAETTVLAHYDEAAIANWGGLR